MRLAAGILVIVIALVFAVPTTGRSQFVSVRRTGGEVGLGFDGAWSNSSVSHRTSVTAFEERFRLDVAGYLRDPRLVNFRFFVSPGWRQRTFDGFEGESDGNGRRLNYGIRLSLLPNAPVRIALAASRFDGRERDHFGSETEGASGRFHASLSYPNLFFPTTLLSYDRLSTDALRRSGTFTTRLQDQTLNTLRLGAENRKTRLSIEHHDRRNRTAGSVDVRSTQATITNRQRWGKGSNLGSTFRYLRRTNGDTNGSSTLSWSQSARLQHLLNLSSDYSYRLYSQSNRASSNRGWRWDAGTQYRPLRRLNLGLNGGASEDNLNGAKSARHRIRTAAGYAFPLPLDALFRGGVTLGYDWLDREASGERFITVVNERHIVDASRQFPLDNELVDPASVRVNSADGTMVFEPDFDYRLFESAQRLDVLIIPGSRIAVGDTLLIDYRYEARPSGSGGFRSITLRALIRWGALALSHTQVERAEGNDSNLSNAFVLANSSESRTSLILRLSTPWGPAEIAGERSRTLTKVIDATNYRLRGNASLRVTEEVTGSLGLNVTAHRTDSRPFNVYSANTGLSWRPLPGLHFSSHLRFWTVQQHGRVDQESISGGVSGEWRIYRVSLRARYDHLSFSEVRQRTENRLALEAVRRF
jgi:hypothetical protein